MKKVRGSEYFLDVLYIEEDKNNTLYISVDIHKKMFLPFFEEADGGSSSQAQAVDN